MSDKSELAEAQFYIGEATKAITGLTVGGSEFFIRKGDTYRADLKACVEHIRERFERGHQIAATAVRERKVAEAERDALLDAVLDAIDLLAERKYGSPARSPGHNARLVLEGALAKVERP